MNYLLRRRKLGFGSCTGIKAASTTGIEVVRNDKVPPEAAEGGFVFRWGCTSNVAGNGHTIVNPASAIHWCSNKKQGRLDMQAAGVPVPETWTTEDFLAIIAPADSLINETDLFVARPAQHAQGRNLNTGTARNLAWEHKLFDGGYVSRKINKVAEYRVMVVQGRVAWVAKKTPGNPDEVAWNVARGGRFDNVRWGEWPMAVIKAALAAAKVGELDFGGVDVMTDAEGNAYVLEVNSAPSQTSPYRQQCVAKCFDYIVNNGKNHFPEFRAGQQLSWKTVIHPALRGE